MQGSLILFFLMGQCCFINCHLYEYHYINKEKTWTEAQQFCREKYTDLATVTSMADMERLSNSAGDMEEAWIGLYDQTDVSRTWYWSLPGVEFDENETNWSSGEPTDRGNQKSENCGHVNQNLKWIDTGCENKYIFLCYDKTDKTHKYHFIREQKTWQEAQIYCRENHTDLISGMKQLQDEELKKVMNSAGNEPVYIGLFRDRWRWSDGSSFSFRHWKKEFSNTNYNSGQCAMSMFDDKCRWKTENCTVRKPFICYDDKVILIKENKTWEDALYYCREHYHDLVTITNLDEQRWVQEKAKNASTAYVWMGLRYTCTLDFWFWVSDEVVIYKNWASKELMDDCDMSGAMETVRGHQWRKKEDHYKFNFICSKN